MAINIKYPLSKSPKGGFATNDTTIEAIADDIRILLLSNYGDRPIHYTFGANLRSITFEQGSSLAQKAKDLIVAALEEWMPFVEVIDLQVRDSNTDPSLRSNEINIRLEYSVGQIVGVLNQRIRN